MKLFGARKQLSHYVAIALVCVGGLMMLIPFYFMFVFATHTRADIFTLPPPLWFGNEFFTNLALLNSKIPFWRSLGWSLYVAIMSTVLTLFFCSMAGYAFALMKFRFKNYIFAMVLGPMLVPSFMNMGFSRSSVGTCWVGLMSTVPCIYRQRPMHLVFF